MNIIAEIGLNHCGSLVRASNLINSLVKTSVDTISFQIRENEFYDHSHPRKFHLPLSFYETAINKAHQNKKELCIAIAEPNLIKTFNDMEIDSWKTLSWDIKNKKLHKSNSNSSCAQADSKNPKFLLSFRFQDTLLRSG